MKPLIFRDEHGALYRMVKKWKIDKNGQTAVFEDKHGKLKTMTSLEVEPQDFTYGETAWAWIDKEWKLVKVLFRREGVMLFYHVTTGKRDSRLVVWSPDEAETQLKKKFKWHGYIVKGDHELVEEKKTYELWELEDWYENHPAYDEPDTDLIKSPLLDDDLDDRPDPHESEEALDAWSKDIF